MNYRQQVAHHEAAHAVLAYRLGASVLEQGINIDAPSSVAGAYGNAAVNIFAHDDIVSEIEQMQTVVDSVAIMCAGAASDAKILQRPLPTALAAQPVDHQSARDYLLANPLIGSPKEADHVLKMAMERTAKLLNRPEIWSAVERIAQACIDNGGILAKPQIDRILKDAFPEESPPTSKL